jgi:hypothetical protein
MQNEITIDPTINNALFETGYNAALADIQSLSEQDVVAINLDVMGAVATATGSLPELRNLREQIIAELPKFDIARFDKLHNYALALGYAHAEHLISEQPPEELKPLLEEGIQLRETLVRDAQTLAARGLLNGEALRSLKGPNGYKNVAIDLQILAQLLKANWAAIQGKCAIDEGDFARAAALASRLIHVVGLREQGPAGVARTADLRARAFTLFTRCYDDARRAVIYLRWHQEDADTIAPSLYAGRSNGRTGVTRKPLEPTAAETASPPAAVPASPNPAPSGPAVGNGGPFVS